MVKNKTVIVLGAGASREANLPTGEELLSDIANLLDIRFDTSRQISGDHTIYESIKEWEKKRGSKEFNVTRAAACRISKAMSQASSIDSYIDIHSGDERIEICGKLAIVRSILAAESKSDLTFDKKSGHSTIDFKKNDNFWLKTFFKLIVEDCPISKLPERLSKLVFVIFNYDRCVEHYLYHAFQNFYGIDAEQASNLITDMEIYHPYGQVGGLEWQGSTQFIEFGGDPGCYELLEISSQIRTFTEGTDPKQSNIEQIRRYIDECSMLIFLGFAFHKQNLHLLFDGTTGLMPKYCFGTVYNFSTYDMSLVTEEIKNLLITNPRDLIFRNDLKCQPFLREYWRGLSLS